MENNHLLWNKLTENEQKHLTKLLCKRKLVEAITYVLGISRLNVGDARNFIDNTWLHLKATDCLTPKDEFKAEVLSVVTGMLDYVNDPDMLAVEKYQFIADNHIPMLLALCMED